jgi:hypothetical protein
MSDDEYEQYAHEQASKLADLARVALAGLETTPMPFGVEVAELAEEQRNRIGQTADEIYRRCLTTLVENESGDFPFHYGLVGALDYYRCDGISPEAAIAVVSVIERLKQDGFRIMLNNRLETTAFGRGGLCSLEIHIHA